MIHRGSRFAIYIKYDFFSSRFTIYFQRENLTEPLQTLINTLLWEYLIARTGPDARVAQYIRVCS